MAANVTLTLPVDDGTANQVLATDGDGVLSWATQSASSIAADDITAGDAAVSITTVDESDLTLGNAASDAYFKVAASASAGNEDIRIVNTNGTDDAAIAITATAGGIDIEASSGVDFSASTIANYSASTVSITATTTLSQALHNGKVLICDSSSDIDLDIDANSILAGFNCLIVQKGAGEITIDIPGSGVTVNNRNSHEKTADQWAVMTLLCIDATTDANIFVSAGDGVSE
jgi:hypothetical protein